MADNQNQTTEDQKDEEVTQNQTDETTQQTNSNKSENKDNKDSNLVKNLRKQVDKYKKELDAKNQEEADKNKTLEEKLAEKDQQLQQAQQEKEQREKSYSLEKQLLKSNINPELVDLMLSEGVKIEADDVETVVTELQSKYPSAFVDVKKTKTINNNVPTAQSGANKVSFEDLKGRSDKPKDWVQQVLNQ